MSNHIPSHVFDLRDRTCGGEMLRQLSSRGIARVDGIGSGDDLLWMETLLGPIFTHRDSMPNGLTFIEPLVSDANPDNGGFGRGALFPHTDSTTAGLPPAIMVLACNARAETGGESLFVDSKRVYEEMFKHFREELSRLAAEECVIFSTQSGYHRSSFFSMHQGRIVVRFRLDSGVYPRHDVGEAFLRFAEVIESNVLEVSLAVGEGMIFSNSRWLHGRRAFQGHRSMCRLLFGNLDTVDPSLVGWVPDVGH